jgi:ankyrin repeat protein
MIQPVEMAESRPMELHDDVVSTTTDVWNMLVASRAGNLDRVKEAATRCSALLTCQFDYTTPLHFAVLEGHLDLVNYLVQRGALDPTYLTHPFRDSLVTMAEDRGQVEIAQIMRQSITNPELTREWGDTGKIDFGKNEIERRFQELVDKNNHAEVETLLKKQPELALDKTAFWGEGILCMPAKNGDRRMIELLMRYGAVVPDLSKWGARYYFKNYETSVFLMESGMNPNHMNWRQFSLLHDMAFLGDIRKARLLLDHGANINAIDDEYRSTPLGYAARWGKREMVGFLLDRGADVNKAAAPWAAPLAWARKKGHAEIEADLRLAGAVAEVEQPAGR